MILTSSGWEWCVGYWVWIWVRLIVRLGSTCGDLSKMYSFPHLQFAGISSSLCCPKLDESVWKMEGWNFALYCFPIWKQWQKHSIYPASRDNLMVFERSVSLLLCDFVPFHSMWCFQLLKENDWGDGNFCFSHWCLLAFKWLTINATASISQWGCVTGRQSSENMLR